MQSTPDQILFRVEDAWPGTGTRDLAARIGITRQAARAHLEKLATEDLVEHSTSPDGVGPAAPDLVADGRAAMPASPTRMRR